MNENEKSKEIGQKSDEMNAMDQGLNFFSQVVNNATGIDKGNDGKINNEE
ncbi:hypothetical protein ACUXCC_004531 [Cytobacillus horneckiae]|nr:hypothetical protein [Cytobacillus horneckiae]MBN6889262.1 hypothetical protein [Cytobacillus horneckiae]MCM3178482.1 hypothetical protein [Cytobacillus horneckiae]MEC1156780.1 hypothetical protein [Cytobacillus horneckiae]MED2940540.1 hypothetical protein [Cytobacillus horneckiae]